ncbi:hypothetical protein [Desulfitobacterium sp. LBE]|uniref:hypothetical protein n=1 Tax=Desulfitobacterium sp. LBE TaxID=884086 RepID=UPI0011A63A3A|nr:hypothetical protein [Desulfitobacterium sp. LBE]
MISLANNAHIVFRIIFQGSSWRLLAGYGENIRDDIPPSWDRYILTEFTELIDCLLEARRPRAAFQVVEMDFNDIKTSRLKRLLRDTAIVNDEPAGISSFDGYHISEALDSPDGRAGVTSEELAQLEFLHP